MRLLVSQIAFIMSDGEGVKCCILQVCKIDISLKISAILIMLLPSNVRVLRICIFIEVSIEVSNITFSLLRGVNELSFVHVGLYRVFCKEIIVCCYTIFRICFPHLLFEV